MRFTAPIAATLLLAAAAHAQLDGTVINIEQDFSDCLTQGDYTYGQTLTLIANNDPNRKWKLSGPAHQPGYNNSVLCDYSAFKLGKNAHTDTFIFFNNIDLPPAKGTAQAFNGDGKKIGVATDYDNGFFIQIPVDSILSAPVQMVVAWNTEGAPPPCDAGLNGDGTLDLFDFLQFTNLFNDHDGQADCDADGEFSLFDFLCFTNEFNAAC
jgi:hypothetical protein